MDLSQREGNYPVPAGASRILGVEFSGVIDESSPDGEALQTLNLRQLRDSKGAMRCLGWPMEAPMRSMSPSRRR
jgi:hypothetical protein